MSSSPAVVGSRLFMMLLGAAATYWSRHHRLLSAIRDHRLFQLLTPAACVTSLIAALFRGLLSRSPGVSRLCHLLESVALFVGYPITLSAGVEEPGEADWVALLGIFLGTLLGHRQASVMLLLMVTGGELLEDYAMVSAGQAVDALVSWKARAPQRVTCLVPKSAVSSAQQRRAAPPEYALEVCDVQNVRAGTLVVVRGGEVIPIDGAVVAMRGPNGERTELTPANNRRRRDDDDGGDAENNNARAVATAAGRFTLECLVRETDLTGETQPVVKRTGGNVLSGTSLQLVRVGGGREAANQTPSRDDEPGPHQRGNGAENNPACGRSTTMAGFTVNNSIVVEASCSVDKCTSALVSASWEKALNEQSGKAKFERVSSRYAALFTPFTFAIAAGSAALMAPQPGAGSQLRQRLERAVCVLMAATPCPLSIGVPIAFIGAMSTAARAGITFKRATAVEDLASATTVVLDKTGTLTHTDLQVEACVFHCCKDSATFRAAIPKVFSAVRLAESESTHVVGRCLFEFTSNESAATTPRVSCASSHTRLDRDLSGRGGGASSQGVEADFGGTRVLVGSLAFVSVRTKASPVQLHSSPSLDAAGADAAEPSMHVYVVLGDKHVATFVLSNEVRAGAAELLYSLRRTHGLNVAILSGDTTANVTRLIERIISTSAGSTTDLASSSGGKPLALSDITIVGNCLPHDKVEFVQQLMRRGEVVVMVGDGLNDAAALAAAHVGIAIGSCSHGLTEESADAVLLSQELRGIAKALAISRNALDCSRGVAQYGMGASLVQMVAAAAGYLPPFANSVLQEVVDLSAIVKALTVLSFKPP